MPVGVAEVDITPDYPIRMTGYGNRKTESEGAEQRLKARALAIAGDAPPVPTPARRAPSCSSRSTTAASPRT